jgi:mycothiol synthase
MTLSTDPAPDLEALRVNVPEAPPIPGLRFRRFAGAPDLPGMVRVSNAARGADGDPEVATVAMLEVDYANLTNCDLATDILLADVDGELVAYSRVFWEDMSDGSRGYHSFGFVDPAWRRRGIGRAMLRHNERRSIAVGEGHPPDRPRALLSWGYESALGNVALLRSEGYTPTRSFVHMIRPTLDAIDVAPLPEGLVVRPATVADAEAVFHADAEAFLDHWGGVDASPEALERWRGNPNFDPSLWAVAWAGDQVAGGVLGLVDPEENEEHDYLRGWLDSVFVRRPWRRRGLANALIGRCLVTLRERGMTSAQLGVDVDNDNRALDLYTKAGFVVHQEETAWSKPWPLPVPLSDGEPTALTWRRR